ncbi:MAG: hypothetical protein AAFX04_02355 [Pseudomonadota bacterium]
MILSTMLAHLGPFQESKVWIEDMTGLDKMQLHIVVGLLAFVLVLAAQRKPRSWLPLVVALFVALLGEILDIYELIAVRGWGWGDIYWPWHWEDIVATAGLPLLLFILLRAFYRPGSGRLAGQDGASRK